LTSAGGTGTHRDVISAGYYFFGFGFWAYFTRKLTGGCRET